MISPLAIKGLLFIQKSRRTLPGCLHIRGAFNFPDYVLTWNDQRGTRTPDVPIPTHVCLVLYGHSAN